MKRFVIKYLMCCLGVISGFLLGQAQNLVVPGKTWWYQSFLPSWEDGRRYHKVILALEIEDAAPDDPEWYPCVALDSLSRPVLDTPLAWLREEGSRVLVRPNLTLYEHAASNDSNEKKVLGYFLGYWYGNEIPRVTEIAGNDGLEVNPVWNVKDQREFLLYDFSYTGGEVYEWPWSGVYLDFSGYKDSRLPEGGMEVTNVGTRDVICADGKKRTVKSFTMGYSNIIDEGLLVLDGIGAVDTPRYDFGIESYVPCYSAWYGFFIAPLSLGNLAITSIFSQPSLPDLIYVKDSGGSVIYYDNYYYNAGVDDIKTSLASSILPLYDLHGRKVSAPVPGSIYIRDGKKFVAR